MKHSTCAALSFAVLSLCLLPQAAHATGRYGLPLSTGTVNSYFDHTSPQYTADTSPTTFTRYDGQAWIGGSGNATNCTLGTSCYDGHNGIDFQASVGTNIYAAASGVIRSIGWENPNDHSQGYGYFLRLWHSSYSNSTLYGHLTANSETSGLAVGSSVSQGDLIAKSGNTGDSTGAHLHFSVFNADNNATGGSIDPFGWSGSGSDPWTIDQGYLWTTSPPSYGAPPPTPGTISITSGGVTHGSALAISSTASLGFQVQNTGQQAFALASLDMEAVGPNSYSAYLGAQSLSSLGAGGSATYAFSAASFLSGCSFCVQGTYTFYPKYRDAAGTVHDVLTATGGSATVTLPVSDPSLGVAIGTNAGSGQLEIFKRGNDGNIYHDYQCGTTGCTNGWSGWSSLSAGSTLFAGNPAVGSNGSGQEVFARDASGSLWHNYQCGTTGCSNGWSGWNLLSNGSNQVALKGDPYVVNRSDGTGMEVFVLGSDLNLWHDYACGTSGCTNGWSGWNILSPQTQPSGISFRGTTSSTTTGTLEVFTRASDSQVYHNYETSAHTWSGWYVLSGGAPATFAGNPTVARNGAYGIEAFIQGTDGLIWHDYACAMSGCSNGWSGWTALSQDANSYGNAYARPNSGGSLEVFTRASGGTVYHNYACGTSGCTNGWSGWNPLSAGATAFTGDPVATLNSGGSLEVFAKGNDSATYHDYQCGTAGCTNGWSGWYAL